MRGSSSGDAPLSERKTTIVSSATPLPVEGREDLADRRGHELDLGGVDGHPARLPGGVVDVLPGRLARIASRKLLVDSARVALNSGHSYGAAYDGFVRLNFACDPILLLAAVERITAYID